MEKCLKCGATFKFPAYIQKRGFSNHHSKSWVKLFPICPSCGEELEPR